MYRLLVGFISGVIITSLISLAIFSFTQVTGQEEGTPAGMLWQELGRIYSNAVTEPINNAGAVIKDDQMSQYYQELVKECALESSAELGENASLSDMVPDITKINSTAITLPVLKARENIKDEEIRKFYDQLIKRIGWDTE